MSDLIVLTFDDVNEAAQVRETLRDGFMLRRQIDSGGARGELRVVVQDHSTGSIGSIRVPIGTE